MKLDSSQSVEKLRNNSTFFDFSEKCENLKKTQEISEFDVFAISANMKKTQENRRDYLNWTNLKIPLQIYDTTRKSEKNSSYFAFSGDSKE